MGIKPALGWLALLLFTTTATQAEGLSSLKKDLSQSLSGLTAKGATPAAAMTVTAKTKAPPRGAGEGSAGASGKVRRPESALVLVSNTIGRPRADYKADVLAIGAASDDVAATPGHLVTVTTLPFSDKDATTSLRQRKAAYKIDRDRIRRVTRFVDADLTSERGRRLVPTRNHIDVIETIDSFVLVETRAHASGPAASRATVTSDVFTFPRSSTLEERVAMLDKAAPDAQTRERLAEALVAAE